MSKPPNLMTRDELLEEVRRLRRRKSEEELRRVVLELQVYREEVRQQNEELVSAQRGLELTLSRYADLYDSAPVGYVTLDENGIVQELNRTCCELLKRKPEQVVGKPFLFHVDDAAAFLMHLSRCGSGEQDFVVSEISVRAGEQVVPVELRSRVVLEGGRQLLRTTLTDLSERKRAEAERQELIVRERVSREANEAKDQFLAILSHELRNPLAAISASASVLAEAGTSLPASLSETVSRIQRNVMSEARLITDLLDASRLRHGKLRIERRPVDLHLVLADAIAGLTTELPGFRVHKHLDAERHFVTGDATRLGQVIANLLRNAHEATLQGGEIRVLLKNPTRDRVTLSVIDSGRGIDPATLPELFVPFEQGRRQSERGEGLGLGLVISRGLVEAHGGVLRALSAGLGQGARFDVELHALDFSGRVEAAHDPPAQAVGTHRILLVDDHRDAAESLAALLEQQGFEVMLADSIASALEQAERGFDILVSDLALPDGNGRDLARRLSERGPLRAIAVSGYGADSDVAASRAAGFRAHLVKPVEPARLIKVIAHVTAA
jgi:PAS domain S-box-containing protein